MRAGIHLPQWGVHANRAAVIDVAQAAEECGFDSVWVADHIVIPMESESKYPYRADSTPFDPDDGFLEAFTLLSVVAGATERVRLGTSVLVLPMRHPLEVAKIAATLDVLSGGRVELAVGAGWWREEFDALDQRFEARGRRMDEQIRIMKQAWTERTFAFSGDHYDFPELACQPLPVQAGGPPVLIGGLGDVALRRVARLGDGWHVVGSKLDALAEMRTQLDGVSPDLPLSTSAGMPRQADRARERLAGLAASGVGQVVFNADESPFDLIALLQLYRDEVFAS